jgi:hypothetical protein
LDNFGHHQALGDFVLVHGLSFADLEFLPARGRAALPGYAPDSSAGL